jgi:hypothetical protein
MSIAKKKNIIFFIIVLLIAGAATGYYFYNKGPVNIKNADAQKTTAIQLYSAFLSDSAAAQKKYSGKILSVTGIVSQVNTNQQGLPVILLETNNGAGFINCTMEEKTTIIIKEKQSIQIKGICSGLGQADEELGLQPDLYLERCILQP